MNHQQSKLRFDQKLLLILVKNVWILPAIMSAIIIAGCFVPYIISVHYERVYPILPYISDAGAQLPAAPYFSQILDFGGVIVIIVFWLRFVQINYYLTVMIAEPSESIDMEKQSKTTTTENKKLIKRLHLRNMIALIFGVIGGFGIISVGNFRDTENLTLHNTSVIVMVAAFSVLMIENIIIAYHLNQKFHIESCPITWIILKIITFIFIINLLISLIILFRKNHKALLDSDKRANWQPNMDGYPIHLSCTISEYIFFITYSLIFLIFAKRFYQFKQWDKTFFKYLLN
ncbi:photoreceptor cell maintenance [Dermatophagoides pteronyssinus]|uniref:Photoreceptor cell maintenance n=1 Tax=Dermatophagoides pteronyssinus TaxID=6956 RepID=A0ABQ8JQU1_DERPT|nr:photoreceptor cell maintenance [Dermatophagoides pteronyssinus]